MRPEVWGKALWQTMHAVALGYPSEPTEYQKLAYRSFYAGLGEVIPCESCSASYRRMMHKRGGLVSLDEALEGTKVCKNSTSPLFDWTVTVHNAVSEELGKPSSWTPERTRTAVMRGGSEGAQECSKNDRGMVIATWRAMAVGFIFAFAFVALCITLYRSIRNLLAIF